MRRRLRLIRTIDFEQPKMMLALIFRLRWSNSSSAWLDLHRQADLTVVQRGVVEQRIEAVDQEIDALVYALYGLSEDEREIVEGG